MLQYFLIPLTLTEIIELAVSVLIFRIRTKDDIFSVFIVNLVTNLSLNLILLLISPLGNGVWLCAVIILEILIFITEALLFRRLTDFSHPFRMSLVLNALSFCLGLLIL